MLWRVRKTKQQVEVTADGVCGKMALQSKPHMGATPYCLLSTLALRALARKITSMQEICLSPGLFCFLNLEIKPGPHFIKAFFFFCERSNTFVLDLKKEA